MAATNVTTTVASNKATTLTTSSAATGTTSNAAATQAATPSTGLPTFDLATFLGLPTVIDYQDIAIRLALVLTGILLLLLVAWAFVRGKQSTNVQVQVPPTVAKEATEAAEVA